MYFKYQNVRYKDYKIEKLVLKNNKIYGAVHSEIVKMDKDCEAVKFHALFRVKHDVIFKSLTQIFDFTFSPDEIHIIALTQDNKIFILE